MANPYIWGDLDRATNDNTKIDQAIDEAITAHNDDPDAHLGAEQALESHRASEIIDHRAESVVNDKIATIARAYVAIVDPASDVDFDTINSAVTYAVGKGGGTIFLAPGNHYISGILDVPPSINFYSADVETCTIFADKSTGDYMNIVDDVTGGQLNMSFTNIELRGSGGALIYADFTTLNDMVTVEFTNCEFYGGGTYIDSTMLTLRFTRTRFAITSTPAIYSALWVRLFECEVLPMSGASAAIFVEFQEYDYGTCQLIAYDSLFNFQTINYGVFISTAWDSSIKLYNCTVYNWDYQNAGLYTFALENCIITGRTNRVYTIRDDGNEGTVAFNSIYASGTGYVQISADTLKFIGNYLQGARSHISSGAQYYLDMDTLLLGGASLGQTALDLGRNRVCEFTPNASRTYTTTVPAAAETRTVIVLTSGTTNYVCTFGTGFKTTGTLSTGTVSARRFVINFVSTGTYLIETSRTVAMA